VNLTLDLTGIVERLREDLVGEIREQVRVEIGAAAWPEWMAIETAARYLDAPIERLRKLKERGEIPFHQEGPGCRVFFARQDLDAWMTTYRHEARDRR
jgi:excisionase family DNA binding protein